MKIFSETLVSRSKLLIVNSLAVLFFLFWDPSVLTAQDLPRSECQAIYAKAVAYDKAGDYKNAILKYNAVKACDPNFKLKADLIILTVFTKLNTLREQAEKDKQKAVLAQSHEKKAKQELQKALEKAKIQEKKADSLRIVAELGRKKTDSLRIVAELGQRKADNLSKYYKRKAEQADRVLLLRISEYMHLKHAEDDVAERIYNENLSDTSVYGWSKSQILAMESQDAITTIAVSPDGQRIFTGDSYGVGMLWDLDGYRLESFIGHYGSIVSACFSPDGKTILTASQDKTVNLWTLDGKLVRTLFTIENEQGISYAAFSEDAQKILTVGYNEKTATLWDTAGIVLKTFKGHDSRLTALDFSANGQYILTGSADSTTHLYAITGELIKIFNSHESTVLAVAISPNGEYIATTSSDTAVWLWDKQGRTVTHFKDNTKVTTLSFSENNAYLLMGSADGRVHLWHWADTTMQTLKGHKQYVSAVAFVPRSNYAVSAAYDRTLRLWDLRTDKLFEDNIHLQDKGDMEVYFSPDDYMFAVLSKNGDLRIYTPDNKLLLSYKEEGIDEIVKATFSPDSKSMLIATRNQKMKLLNLKDTTLLVFQADSLMRDAIIALAFSADGQFILSQTRQDKRSPFNNFLPVKLWNRQGQLLKKMSNIEGDLEGFSANGQSFLTLYANEIFEWNLAGQVSDNYGLKAQYFSAESNGNPYVFQKQKRVAFIGYDNKIRVFNDLGVPLRTYPSPDTVTALCMTGDGQRIAIGGKDGTVRIWDTSGYLVKVLPRQKSSILALNFLPDNQEIWVCTVGGQIAIYNMTPIQSYSLFQLNNLGLKLEPEDILNISNALIEEQENKKELDKRNNENNAKRYKAQNEARKKQREKYLQLLKEIVKTQKATVEEMRSYLPSVLRFTKPELDSNNYQAAETLFQLYLVQKDSIKFRTVIANNYNSLAWNQLLSKEYAAAEKSLRRGLAIDSTTIILYTNLAPCLLFQGKFEAAKAEYLRWKDKAFNQQDLATFRDAFWADFRSFEDADCIPPERLADVAAIKKLLEK